MSICVTFSFFRAQIVCCEKKEVLLALILAILYTSGYCCYYAFKFCCVHFEQKCKKLLRVCYCHDVTYSYNMLQQNRNEYSK